MSGPETTTRLAGLSLVAALAASAAFLQLAPAESRESALPLLRAAQRQEKGLDRAAGAALALSLEEERALGRNLDAAIPRASAGSPLEGLVSELGAEAARSPLVERFRGRYEFRLAPGEELNAFALPGGYVRVGPALAERLRGDEAALLFVLGHEIGHVELGHCADGHRVAAWRRLAGPAADLAGLARALAALHFSETQELEADAFAVRLLASIRRDPAAALRAMDSLGLPEERSTHGGLAPGRAAVEALADYFKTHPGAWERRAALRAAIAKL